LEDQQGGKKEEEMWHAPMQVAEQAGKAYLHTSAPSRTQAFRYLGIYSEL